MEEYEKQAFRQMVKETSLSVKGIREHRLSIHNSE